MVSGRVTDAFTGAPLAGATLSVAGDASVVTDATGYYQFTGLVPGSAGIAVEAAGYLAASVSLATGSVERIDFALSPDPTPRPTCPREALLQSIAIGTAPSRWTPSYRAGARSAPPPRGIGPVRWWSRLRRG
ncbi:hypothetical protein JCM17961_44080 [Endothiovibrio diazotrophicus]